MTALIWAVAIVLIVGIVGLTEVLKAKYRGRHGITTDIMGNEKPMVPAEVRREVEDLRERLKVLERITIDDRETHLLSDEIEKLRLDKGKVQ